MKIYKLLTIAAAAALLASCDLNKTPEFEDSRSFAAFDKTSIAVNEDAGVVKIPVTIASIDPKKVAVAYTVTDGEGNTGAKLGVNYKLTDESAVVAFDGKARTMEIEIEIINYVGYTGDLTFTVEIVSAGGLEIGANSTCTVKISDLDHPLAAILGEYGCKAKDKGQGDVEWTMTMSKDPTDVTVVWIDYICPLAANNPSMKFAVYGKVSEDRKTISIPCGQKPGAMYGADDPFTFIWFDYDGGYQVAEEGYVTMTSTEDGVYTTEDGMGFCSAQYVFNGGMILKGTAVWTKK